MKRLNTGIAAVMITASVLAGCGDNSPEKNNGASDQIQTLKLYLTAQDAPGTEALAKAFEANNKVKITIERAPDDQYTQLISARLASKDGPDIWLDWPEVSKVKARIGAGYIEDLSGLGVLSSINDKMLEPFKVDGKTYGIPWALNFMGLYYNKDLFAKHNLSVPVNYKEFTKLCEDLKSLGLLPIALNGKDDWAVQFPWFDIVASTVYSKAKDADWDDKRYAGKTTFTSSPLWKDSAAKYENLMAKGYFGKANVLVGTTYDQAKKLFADGQAGMIVDGSWSLQGYKDIAAATGMNIGTMALPANDEGEQTILTAAPSTGFVIWSGSKNKDLAKKFLEFIYSEANASTLAGKGSLITAKASTAEPDPIFAGVMPFIKQGNTYEFCNINWPNGPQADGLQKETQAALGGASTFTKVLEIMDKSWDKNTK